MARCYAELGRAFALLDDLPRAMELYELAIEYLDETSQAFFPRILTEYADLLERTGRLQEALDVYKRATTIAIGRHVPAGGTVA